MSLMIVEYCPECGGELNASAIFTKINDNHSKIDYKFVCNKCGYEKYEDEIETLITSDQDYDYDGDEYEDDFDPYESKNMKFIWGEKSWDDLCDSDACLYTMNDIDLIYLKDEKKYLLSLETIFMFEKEEHKLSYLKECLDAFTKFMVENGYNTEVKPHWWDVFMSGMNTHFDSIEECYGMFKLLVNGYCKF